MAATSSYMSLTKFSISMLGWSGRISDKRSELIIERRSSYFSISAQQQQEAQVEEAQQEAPSYKVEEEEEEKEERIKGGGGPRPVEPQRNVKSKNMGREYGGQWLSSATRHVRIYAAYIDPVTCEFDQTQMDKLTLILDPTNEFEWTPHTCNLVYSYFQDLVDHYEGAPLTEYTLRLIGSDIEHYIRKLLYDGEIRYNMNAKVLNFSMGKPRIGFNYDGQLRDINQ